MELSPKVTLERLAGVCQPERGVVVCKFAFRASDRLKTNIP